MTWDALLAHEDLEACLESIIEGEAPTHEFQAAELLAPIDGQEVWAAGVTYYRSRGARMEESKDAGGGNFYDRVYSAERPELFFKSTASRTVGQAARCDSQGCPVVGARAGVDAGRQSRAARSSVTPSATT